MNEDPWARLGRLLISRRVELGYKTRAAFARAHGLSHDRGISAVENAERTNFSPSTLAALEQQYEWEPGSIAAVLAGDEPTPRGASAAGRLPATDLSDVPDVLLLAEIASRFARAAEAKARESADRVTGLAAAEHPDELQRRRDALQYKTLEEYEAAVAAADEDDVAARETDVRGDPIRSRGRELRRHLDEIGQESQDPDDA